MTARRLSVIHSLFFAAMSAQGVAELPLEEDEVAAQPAPAAPVHYFSPPEVALAPAASALSAAAAGHLDTGAAATTSFSPFSASLPPPPLPAAVSSSGRGYGAPSNPAAAAPAAAAAVDEIDFLMSLLTTGGGA